jgi:hypothetical protein
MLQAITTFQWGQGQKTRMSDFLSQYNGLHDSNWVGMWHEPFFQQTTAVFKWDTFFCSERIPYSIETGKWPILLIHFPRVHFVSYKQGADKYCPCIISEATSTPISNKSIEWLDAVMIGQNMQDLYDKLPVANKIQYTIIKGIQDDDEVHIIHDEEVFIRCMDSDGEQIDIPGI